MYRNDIHKELRKHNLPVWKLCQAIGISRDTYYKYSHTNFKGHEKSIQDGLNTIIAEADKKAGEVHAD